MGASRGITAIRGSVGRLLASQMDGGRPPPVLILGETGTGKGLLARLLHDGSGRAAGPFVPVNCAAIPENLLEAELFGVERGAYTGADQARPGLFRAADRGTIFLDEIGALPLPGQAKLLTAIEDRVVRPLGGARTRPVDVWIIAATSEDLGRALAERRFREDLYHRLATIPLTLPPLRERGADVLLLAEHFLARACGEFDRPPKSLGPDAREALLAHAWPGNVRELANVMERAALLAEAPLITAAALELPPRGPPTATAPTDGAAPPPIREALSGFERARIVEALEQSRWNVVRAAELLGIPRTTLRRRMAEYQLASTGDPVPRSPRRVPDVTPRDAAPVAPATAPTVRWERRAVTLLCVEVEGVEGGTAAVTGIGQALETVADRLASFGGRVVRIWPHRVAAAFGAEPVADAPVRAAQAALAIQRAADRARDGPGGTPTLRLALHLAALSVGQVAGVLQLALDDEHPVWSALDELLRAAEPNGVMASAAVLPYLDRAFVVDGDGAPGSRPQSYRAGRIRPRPPAGIADPPASRFVGRAHELAVLEARLATAEAGHGQVVGIIGEPGIGKSRLLLEFRRRLDPARAQYHEGHCLASGQGTPYGPVLDLVRATCGLTEPLPDRDAIARVQASLARLGMDAAPAAPYLLHLLGLPGAGDTLARLTAEAARTRNFEILRQLYLRQSEEAPLVLAIEDVHWCDATSEAFLGTLAAALPGARILVCVTYRPGHRPPWMGHSHATQLGLSRLSPEESLELARSLLGRADLEERRAGEAVARAAGNPFFLEELLRSLDPEVGPDAALPVPESVQATILARMQQLSGAEARLLRTAAVLGPEVPTRLLRAVCARPDELDAGLQQLIAHEFLQVHRDPTTHAFRHGLTHEVAYATLDPAERTRLHEAAGRALERLHGGQEDAVLDRLAYHYGRAERADKAVGFLMRAGDRAARAHAMTEAVGAFRDARRHAERLADPAARDHLRLELAAREATCLMDSGDFVTGISLLTRHQGLIDGSLDPRLRGSCYWLLSLGYSQLGRHEETRQTADRALELAESCADRVTLGRTHWVLSVQSYWAGRYREGLGQAQTGIAALEATDDRLFEGHAWSGFAINAIALGRFAEARAAAARIRRLATETGDPALASYAGWKAGWVHALCGEADEAIASCRHAVEVAPTPLRAAMARMFLGLGHLARGDEEAVPVLAEVVRGLQELGMSVLEAWFTAYLAEAHLLRGDVAAARRLALHGENASHAIGFAYGLGVARRALGRIDQAEGLWDGAAARLTAALATFSSLEARYEAARTRLDLAAVARRQGQLDAAGQHLCEARDAFEALEAPHYAARAAALLRELEGS